MEKPVSKLTPDITKSIYNHFRNFLLTGGYLSAINDYAIDGRIFDATYKTYLQWIIGDMLKRGKSEDYLREIMTALIPRLSKQITWNNFTKEMSIDHHQTVVDYMELLSRMDVTFILQALREDKLRGPPKKARKVHFDDPFIFHTMHAWAKNKGDAFEFSQELMDSDSDLKNALIEGTVSALFRRGWESYYIKGEREVDLAIIDDGDFYPIEVKNSLVLNRKDLKQILKYRRGLVAYAGSEIGKFEHLDVFPIPLVALMPG